jgi:uncharacterized protein
MVSHMKTTIDIADDLLLRARKIAEREKTTLKSLAEEGLRLAIERREAAPPPVIEPFVVTGRDPRPDLSWQTLREILYGNEAAALRE